MLVHLQYTVALLTKVTSIIFSPSPFMPSVFKKRLKRCNAWGGSDPRWGAQGVTNGSLFFFLFHTTLLLMGALLLVPESQDQQRQTSDSCQEHTGGDYNDDSDDSYDSCDDFRDESDEDEQEIPPWGVRYMGPWRRDFVPALIAWAGAHENPFRLNDDLHHVAMDIWSRVFPGDALQDDDITVLVKVVR